MTTCKRLAPTGDLGDFVEWLDAYEETATSDMRASDQDTGDLAAWCDSYDAMHSDRPSELNDALADWWNTFVPGPPAAPASNQSVAVPAPKAPHLHEEHAPSRSQKVVGNTQKPWYPPFPAVTRVSALRMQYFDNGANPGPGKSRHCMKLRAYFGITVDERNPQWERTIALLDPKLFLNWAVVKNANGILTEKQFDRYWTVAESLTARSQDPAINLALAGHVGSPPGTHYYEDQFLAVVLTEDGHMTATLHVDGHQIVIEQFYQNTRSRKSNAPKMHGLYDPHRLIRGEREESTDLNRAA